MVLHMILLSAVSLLSLSSTTDLITNKIAGDLGNSMGLSKQDKMILSSYGFTSDEISVIDVVNLDKYINRTIIRSIHQEVHIQTVYEIENDEVVKHSARRLSNEDLIAITNNTDELLIPSVDDSFQVQSMIIIDGDLGGGSGLVQTKKVVSDIKTYTMYAVFFVEKGNVGEFYLRTTVDWLVNPNHRFVDLLTIGFMDNVMLKPVQVDGQYFPSINSTFTYKETYTSNYSPTKIKEYRIQLDGSDVNNYAYSPNEGLLGLEYDLPSNFGAGGGGYYFNYLYSDFHINLQTEWTPTTTAINGTTFSGWYSHQIGAGSIDWGQVSISPTPPYFSYNTSFWVDDPTFDSGIGGHVMYANIG